MMRSRGWNRRAKLYFSLTVILILVAWTYTWFSREVPLHHHLLVPFAFVTLGMAIKYGDQVFDLNIGSKRKAILLSVPIGLLMGALIFLDEGSATIFIGLLLALLIASKYDNIAFKLGFVVAGSIAVLSVLNGNPFHLVGALAVMIAAFADEVLSDRGDRMEGGKIALLLKERPVLKVAVLVLCLVGALPTLLYFIAFLGFDSGYSFVEQISLSGGIGRREA
ncbi:MAG: hypothetical protein A4E30_00571 [Methanomassiliicoccales archaeon PtaB.Bin215]|nr:MAG: hypothetical protein A4E30_00571 [Methanomassiliicoccales archaeon PtaB.Bin215]